VGILHVCNANFEEELELGTPFFATTNPVFLQLQYLPALYGNSNSDGLVASLKPFEKTALPTHLISDNDSLPYSRVEPWGHSPSIASFAKSRNLPYYMPPWDVVKQVNSKSFSWELSPLAGSELLWTLEAVHAWAKKTPDPKILKTCFGVAGRGHLFDFSRLEAFCTPQFIRKLPVIGEPWVKRNFDFSTQWVISPSRVVQYLGATVCINSAKGRHLENRAGDLQLLFGPYLSFLEEHQHQAEKVLQKIAKLGFFGNVGIDAFIYEENRFQPIVEINARKTMGFAALHLQQHHFRKQTIALSYCPGSGEGNLLPQTALKTDGSTLVFPKRLRINITSG